MLLSKHIQHNMFDWKHWWCDLRYDLSLCFRVSAFTTGLVSLKRFQWFWQTRWVWYSVWPCQERQFSTLSDKSITWNHWNSRFTIFFIEFFTFWNQNNYYWIIRQLLTFSTVCSLVKNSTVICLLTNYIGGFKCT